MSHPAVRAAAAIFVIAVIAWCFLLTQQANTRATRAVDTVCVSHKNLVHAVNALAQDTLTPLHLPPHPTPDQVASYASANKQKAARLKDFEKLIATATFCPHA